MYILTKRVGNPVILGNTIVGDQPVEVAALTDPMLYAYADRLIDISPPPTMGEGELEDAPYDGKLYGRKDGSWLEVSSGGSGLHYTHAQMVPSLSWVIVHNLGRHPSIVVTDSAGTEMTGAVTYHSVNHLTITFSYPFAGIAQLN